jgi:hypothetical protein
MFTNCINFRISPLLCSTISRSSCACEMHTLLSTAPKCAHYKTTHTIEHPSSDHAAGGLVLNTVTVKTQRFRAVVVCTSPCVPIFELAPCVAGQHFCCSPSQHSGEQTDPSACWTATAQLEWSMPPHLWGTLMRPHSSQLQSCLSSVKQDAPSSTPQLQF